MTPSIQTKSNYVRWIPLNTTEAASFQSITVVRIKPKATWENRDQKRVKDKSHVTVGLKPPYLLSTVQENSKGKFQQYYSFHTVYDEFIKLMIINSDHDSRWPFLAVNLKVGTDASPSVRSCNATELHNRRNDNIYIELCSCF